MVNSKPPRNSRAWRALWDAACALEERIRWQGFDVTLTLGARGQAEIRFLDRETERTAAFPLPWVSHPATGACHVLAVLVSVWAASREMAAMETLTEVARGAGVGMLAPLDQVALVVLNRRGDVADLVGAKRLAAWEDSFVHEAGQGMAKSRST